ncbi:fatty acid desaturase [Pseudomonas batumici]|uniref:BatV n=2 Tax=Pseudomonas TaxID=286 RepID=D4NZF7_PSEFL|nr:fatty acid desaturase [Pseudomonas batumici]ADD82963.1 BatV [Pseudomonas fluorescens]KIH86027.1 BatV, batumin synthesis operon, alkane-1 monooxygenase [Pseudomonas batumici]
MKYLKFSAVPLFYMPLLVFSTLWGGWAPLFNLLFILACYFVLDRFSDRGDVQDAGRWPLILDGLMYMYIVQSLIAVGAVLLVASGHAHGVMQELARLVDAPVLAERQWTLVQILIASVSTGFVLSINMVVGHELTHRTVSKLDMAAGNLALAIVADSQFAISHVHCHHKNVATPQDAATARRGESIYRFIVRSSWEQYVEAWTFEKARLNRLSRSVYGLGNRLIPGFIITLIIIAISISVAGEMGFALYLVVVVTSKITYECTNYIQHYGLVRVPGSKVRLAHSWDCHSMFSSAVLLNLTRHSDHHANPNKKYWSLGSLESPVLIEHGYVVQIVRSLFPRYWFRVMERKLEYWENHHATVEEVAIMSEQRRKWRIENV